MDRVTAIIWGLIALGAILAFVIYWNRRLRRSSAQFTPRSTTISIRSGISSPGRFTGRDARPHWRSGAPLRRRSSIARGHIAQRIDKSALL